MSRRLKFSIKDLRRFIDLYTTCYLRIIQVFIKLERADIF